LVLDEIDILAQKKKVAEAERLAEQAVGEPPDVAKSLAVANTMAGVGEKAIARKWATSTMELADESQRPAIHLLLGELALLEAQESGDRPLFEQARDHFAEVVQVQPNHFVAGNNLAWILATEFGQPEEALAVVKLVRGDAPVQRLPVGFIDTLAVVYRGAGELDAAKEMLEESVALYPQSGPLTFHLGMVLADHGQATAAVSNLERALQLGGLKDEQTSAARDAIASLSSRIR
jgi:tetratricopeptide (TPR) repeat protein